MSLGALALDAALRWTLPFALVWAATRSRRLSAAARHHLWALLLAGLVLLAPAQALLPTLAVARPEVAWSAPEPAPAAVEPAATQGAGGGGVPGAPLPTAEGVVETAASAEAAAAPVPQGAGTAAALWRGAWLLVSGVLLAWWAAGHLLVHRLARSAAPACAGELRLLHECARTLGLRRGVRLLVAEGEAVPATWGWLRPVVLLPASSARWPRERLRRVLLHELAHVLRRDPLTHSLARLACALFWFHPGAWYAAAALRREAEIACDDRVVAADGAPVAYAADLLGIARTLRPHPAGSAAVAMAGGSGLEERIRTLLDEGRRRGLSGRVRAALALALLLPTAGVAALRWTEAEAPRREQPGDWLRPHELADGRRAWTGVCEERTDEVCGDATRRGLALLERSGRTGAVVVQRVATGEVAAYVAVRPAGSGRADAVPGAAPGSVAKLALAALWWEAGEDGPVACPARMALPSGRPLRNVGGGRGTIPVEEVIAASCNTGAGFMARTLIDRMGAEPYAAALARSGFDAAGPGRDTLILAGVGAEGVATDPLRVSRFLQAAGNGGVALDGGAAVRLFSGTTAARLRDGMRRTVRDGTGARTLPQLEWSRWGLEGKTGTVKRESDVLDGWFAGIASGPEGGAEYTVVVLLEGGGTGGGAPAGIAAEMTRLLARLRGDEL